MPVKTPMTPPIKPETVMIPTFLQKIGNVEIVLVVAFS